MKSISIRELNQQISKILGNLSEPVEVTKRGVVLCRIFPVNNVEQLPNIVEHNTNVEHSKPVNENVERKNTGFYKHDNNVEHFKGIDPILLAKLQKQGVKYANSL